ncbi:MAG: hypothetical protein ACPICC_08405 [Candidatus Puniceispirillaceae bacterium]
MTPLRRENCFSQNWSGKRLHLILGVIILTSITGCQLERFRHEKYSCQNSNLDISEIVIRNAKKGKEVKIFGYDGERTGIIENISSQIAIIQTEDGSLKLNRKTGALSIQRKNRYTRISCKLSVFTL